MCRDTILQRKIHGSMPLSGVAQLYNVVVACLNGGQLARVELELLGFKRGFLNLVRPESRPIRRMEGFLSQVSRIPGSALSLVQTW